MKAYLGFKGGKIHLFRSSLASEKQREAVTPYLGLSVSDPGGGLKLIEVIEKGLEVGLSMKRQEDRK